MAPLRQKQQQNQNRQPPGRRPWLSAGMMGCIVVAAAGALLVALAPTEQLSTSDPQAPLRPMDHDALLAAAAGKGDELQQLVKAGEAHAASRNWDAALASLQTALQLAPTNPVIRYNLADTMQQLGRRDEARAMYSGLLRGSLTPQQLADLHVRLGHIALQANELLEAAAQFRLAHARVPSDPGLAYSIGSALFAAGNTREALDEGFGPALRLVRERKKKKRKERKKEKN
jgi:tetratricopeptide (TPR) repeat protein